jgi:membrane-associated protein
MYLKCSGLQTPDCFEISEFIEQSKAGSIFAKKDILPMGIAPIIFKILLYIFDAESLIRYGGLLLACLVVYGSTGLFFCFFIPSGGVLFTAGMLVATGGLHHNIFNVCSLLVLSSFLGNITGYWFGLKVGPMLYKRKDSKFFHKKHLKTAESFYKKYGGLALTMGLYLPIIRTFASIVAGMVRLNFLRFLLLTFTGSLIFVLSFILTGYFIGSMPFLKPWVKYIIIIFVLVITIPLSFRMVKELKRMRKENESKK